MNPKFIQKAQDSQTKHKVIYLLKILCVLAILAVIVIIILRWIQQNRLFADAKKQCNGDPVIFQSVTPAISFGSYQPTIYAIGPQNPQYDDDLSGGWTCTLQGAVAKGAVDSPANYTKSQIDSMQQELLNRLVSSKLGFYKPANAIDGYYVYQTKLDIDGYDYSYTNSKAENSIVRIDCFIGNFPQSNSETTFKTTALGTIYKGIAGYDYEIGNTDCDIVDISASETTAIDIAQSLSPISPSLLLVAQPAFISESAANGSSSN